MRHSARALAVTAFGLCAAAPLAAQDTAELGRVTYERWCAGCHGLDGAGQGVAATHMLPRPRDFTLGLYQIRTTASGALPTDADILRMIDDGMPGTAMPGWAELLTDAERLALVEYLKSFSAFFANSPPPEPLAFGNAPSPNEERLAEGDSLWNEIECWRCHGDEGRGDGVSAPTLEDGKGVPIRAADLTENWRFNGGGTVQDIYRRMRTGLDGTPMPSNSDLIDAGLWTEDQLWNIALYVRSLAPETAPEVADVVRANRYSAGPLPTEVDDELWEGVERFYIPLVGQIVQRPRWFDPMVDGVWVQAIHDDSEIAIRLAWSDPSPSPDSAWAAWGERMIELMEPDDGIPFVAGPRPDRIAMQFPAAHLGGTDRPYFLMGDPSDPVNLWIWSSDQEGVREGAARGLGTMDENVGTPELTGGAVFEAGQWRVLFRRSLTTADEGVDVQIPIGEFVPFSLFAWDGDNGEAGARGSVSSWYWIYLTQPTPLTVYIWPAIVVILTASVGLTIVSMAQREERRAPAPSAEPVSSGA